MGNNRTPAEEGLKYNRARVTNTTQGVRQIQKGRGVTNTGGDGNKALEKEGGGLLQTKWDGVKNSPFPSCN